MKLPEWAKWLATDADGDVYAYDEKPYLIDHVWETDSRGQCVASTSPDRDWTNSLRTVGDTPATAGTHPKNKYVREIKPGVFVDVYDVLAAWKVQNPALQHLIKKALQPGERGHKTLAQDMADIVASAVRAQVLEIESGE